jgi:hypothetical protein
VEQSTLHVHVDSILLFHSTALQQVHEMRRLKTMHKAYGQMRVQSAWRTEQLQHL